MKSPLLPRPAATALLALVALATALPNAIARTTASIAHSHREIVATYGRLEKQIELDHAAHVIRKLQELKAIAEHQKELERGRKLLEDLIAATMKGALCELTRLADQLAPAPAQNRAFRQHLLVAEKQLAALEQRKQAAIAELRRQRARALAAAESSGK